MTDALAILAKIADAYDNNDLDDEARKFWGYDGQNENSIPPNQIILYQGRGGRTLLTLEDCLRAREQLRNSREYLSGVKKIY